MATTTSTAARPSDTDADADSGDGQTAVQKLRDQADAVVQRIQPQIAAVATYAREEPAKALLISAAAGAALMGLVALLVRSGGSRSQAPGLSAMAAIREAALDLADSAQTMAADALDAAQKRAVAALETTQKRASAATESVSESMADALKRVREQAGPMVDKIKPQLDAAAAYAKEEPARAALGLAAAGAIVAGLIALARHAQDDSTA
ncbi:MAG TPA: hypothetical protein VGO85_09855 [Caldimonas sp.]|jgi:ElaB/YqjD/DUF883 family membrane-anchored ribosome-binding protein|nr:hypothetical protein [Caldimonas sp.]